MTREILYVALTVMSHHAGPGFWPGFLLGLVIALVLVAARPPRGPKGGLGVVSLDRLLRHAAGRVDWLQLAAA